MFFLLRSGFWLMIVYSSIFRIDIAASGNVGSIDFGTIAASVAGLGAKAPSLCEKSPASCSDIVGAMTGSAVKLVADKIGEAAPTIPVPPARPSPSLDTLKAADRDLLPPRRPSRG